MQSNQNNQIVGVLIEVVTKELLEFWYQNFFRGNFIFGNNEYSYLPITYSPPEKNITRSSGQAEIKLPNIPEILEIVVASNYFKEAEVLAYIIGSDFPNSPALQQSRMVCNSYQIEESSDNNDGEIILQCGKRTNAINGVFPNAFYTTGISASSSIIGYIPEVPLSNSVQLN